MVVGILTRSGAIRINGNYRRGGYSVDGSKEDVTERLLWPAPSSASGFEVENFWETSKVRRKNGKIRFRRTTARNRAYPES